MFVYPIRRLNDLNWKGSLCLLTFVPIVNYIFPLVLMLKKGDEDSNNYGNPPRPNRWYHKIVPIFYIVTIFGAVLVAAGGS